jgi:hypothetical protein
MAVPGDAGRVLTAVRLGWYIAEVRGRNRPDAPPGAKAGLPGPPSHALPLHTEQTPTELRIQAQAELAAMAARLGVDGQIGQVSYSTAIDNQAKRLADARAPGTAAAAAAAAGRAGAGPPAASGHGAGPAAVSGTTVGPATPGGAAMPSGSTGDAGATGAVTAGAATADGTGADAGSSADGGTAGAATAGNGVTAATGTATAAPATDGAAGDLAAQWDVLQDLIFHFDQHIQDTLASEADTVASGYQLGRALAEPYWALEPDLPNSVKSPAAWWFLLGPERCGEMGRLVGRLSAYFHPYTAAAVAGSVQVWKHVAVDPTWRENADDDLYLQTRRWYELVVMGQDPTTLVQPYALIRNFRMVKRALRIFWPELSGAVIAAAALSAFAVALGEHNINSFLKSALGFIAIAGFSLAGLAAKLKNQALAMVKRLRQDVYTDLIAVQISTAPLPPAPAPKPGVFASQRKAIVKSRQKATVTRMVRERNITPVTPN